MNLKKYRYIFSIFLIFSLAAEAKSLLYRVNNQGSTVYILGSIHLAKPEIYPLDKEIIKAYKESDILVVELDPSSEGSMKTIQDAMMNLGMYSADKNLSSELSTKTYMALNDYMRNAGLPMSGIQKMRPWMLMLQLSVEEMIRLGYSPDLGIDKYFLDQAKADNKAIISLETAEEQMALLSKDDKAFQDKLLLYTLESMDEMEPILNDMFIYWREGDADAFDEMISSPLVKDPDLTVIYDDLIVKRNYRMANKIDGYLKTNKNYFVVVGSGHVVGEHGIISLLRDKGYRVKQK